MKATQHLRNERGIGLVSMAIIGAALLAATAIGLSAGRHAFTATEVQAVAEVAATAAAQKRIEQNATDAEGLAAAEALVPKNKVDGVAASTSSEHLSVVFGNFDTANSPSFSPNGAPVNAACAQANATVPNIFPISIPHIFDTDASHEAPPPTQCGLSGGTVANNNGMYTVTKTALAAFTSVGQAAPTLPLALCSGYFKSDCLSDTTCFNLKFTSTGSDAAWTGYFGVASASHVHTFFPSPCGGNASAPLLTASTASTPGSSINLQNGQTSSAPDVWCMVCNLAADTFVVPVVQCALGSQMNGPTEVVGFATIKIGSFVYTNTEGGCADGKKNQATGFHLIEIKNTKLIGAPGGGSYGSGFVTLQG